MPPLTNRNRDRIVDREVMKLRLRDASRRTAADKRPYGDKVAPQRNAVRGWAER